MMKRLLWSLLLVASLLYLVGCAYSRVGEARTGAEVARYDSTKTYWQRVGESYQANGSGLVSQSASLANPQMRFNGALFNYQEQPVRFEFEGRRASLEQVVPPRQGVVPGRAEIQLPAGWYNVRVYILGHQRPYVYGYHEVNRAKGDSMRQGEVLDFFYIAP